MIEWQDLINEAWLRSRATLHAAGLGRMRPTEMKPTVERPAPADEIDED